MRIILKRCCRGLLLAALILSLSGWVFAQAEQQEQEKTTTPAELPEEPSYEEITPPAESLNLNPAKVTPQPTDYVIGPEDVLDIDVFGVSDLSKTVRVANDGTISLALLGHVSAAGLTTKQLREELESKYGMTYLEKPQVSVFVKEFHAQPVSVIGAVERPGLYQLTAPCTLIEVLSMAGGLAKRTSGSAGKTLIVTRKGGLGDLPLAEGMQLLAPDKLEINLRKLLYSQESALNIEIKPLDTVIVGTADIVYVTGDVRKPTGILMEDREKITVLQAFAVAEGLNRTASKKSAKIIRRTEDGKRIEIPVNFGNGGSAALASHMVCDLGKGTHSPYVDAVDMNGVKRFKAISLADNVPMISAWANDSSYENVFAEQLANFIQPGDVAFGISGSGNSANVLIALKLAREKGAITVGFTGFQGGKMKDLLEYGVVVPSNNMQQIEDAHLTLAHMIFLEFRSRVINRCGQVRVGA